MNCISDQSYCIEVVQGGVSSRSRHNWLWILTISMVLVCTARVSLVPWGTLQIQIWFVRQRFDLTLETNKQRLWISSLFWAKKIKVKKMPLKRQKNSPQKFLIISPNYFYHCQYCQPAQNQLKSNFLFHKNVSLCDFNIITLQAIYNNINFGELNEILFSTMGI